MRFIGKALAAPKQRAGLFVQSDDAPLAASRGYYELVAVHKRRFSKTPTRAFATEIFNEIFLPKELAIRRLEAGERAGLIDREEQISIYGRSPPGALKTT